MKKLLPFLLLLLAFPLLTRAQTFNMTNGTVNTCSGTFLDPGGAGNYGNNQNFVYTICSNSSNCIRVNFTSFDTESGFDFLEIFDGPNTSSPLIGIFDGFNSPGTVVSTSGCLTFRFTSDFSITSTGWSATLSCAAGCAPCGPNMANCSANLCSGNFYDSGGPAGNYTGNENLTHTICSNGGGCVSVNFTSFQTQAGSDILTIYDGPNTASPVIGTYSGATIPGTIVSSFGCLTFQFTSNGSNHQAGWQAAVSCVTCPGNFNCLINPVSNGHGFPAGFTQGCDDACSSNNLPLGFTYDICGFNFNSMFVNMNGNVTFGSSYSVFTPVGMPNNTTAVMVAPFWADVDTRACGTVYYRSNPTNAIVTWWQTGYYSMWCDKLNTFQLILSNGNDPLIGVGNNTAFYYQDMNWTTGDASSGVGGFGGSPATAGVNANDNINYSYIGEFDHAGGGYDGPFGSTDGVDFLDNRCFTFPAGNCNILPVNFTRITVVPKEDRYLNLEWETNSESNNIGFEVERSLDGKNFEQIAFVPGEGRNGNVAVQYAYPDHNVVRNKEYFYRLKQLDDNGNHLFSPVVRAMLTDGQPGWAEPAYPNPFDNSLTVNVTTELAGKCDLRLTNQLGQVVALETFEVATGSAELRLDTEELAAGMYILTVELNGRLISVQKLMK